MLGVLDLETIYQRLPVPLQQVACSLEGWRIKRQRYDASFLHLLEAAEGRTYWHRDQLCAFRDERLRKFVTHCAGTVPYYRQRFAEWGIQPEEIRDLEDLASIPVLTKDIVKDNAREFRSEVVRGSDCLWVHTSGTTGSGLRFLTTKTGVQEQWAIWWRYRRWHGIGLDTWCACFAGRSVVSAMRRDGPYWRYNYPLRQILFSGYHISQATLPMYLAELRRQRPQWLLGYPSLLALLATYMLETGENLGYRVRWVTTVSENLTERQTELMRNVFGVGPLQHYGMSEAVANFSQCELGNLHVDEDFAAVRFAPAQNGAGYRVIGTNFSNPAFPFLNYDTKDLVTLDDQWCACGRGGRVVRSIDGRDEDYVLLRDGTAIGRMDHVFKDLIHISEAQIYQKIPGAVVVRVVRGAGYSPEDESLLIRELRQRLGSETAIHLEYSDRLERSSGGKLRLVISEVAQRCGATEREIGASRRC